MTDSETECLRDLYRQACHGAGAEPRRIARGAIKALLIEADISLRDAFHEANLDMAAYFATRPIS
jgi:hypothetical protein